MLGSRATTCRAAAVSVAALFLSLTAGVAPAAAAAVQRSAPARGGGAEAELHNGNAGDIWVDQAGAPPGPGHENDPRLSGCTAVTIWGAGLADGSGTLTIESIPPTRSGRSIVLPWTFPGGGIPRPLATIDAATLEAGLNPSHHGDHFKVALEQDPHKHKTFWLIPCRSGGAAGPAASAGGPTMVVATDGGAPAATAATPPTGGGRQAAPAQVGERALSQSAAAPSAATAPAVAVPSTGVAVPMLSLVLLLGGTGVLLLIARRRRLPSLRR